MVSTGECLTTAPSSPEREWVLAWGQTKRQLKGGNSFPEHRLRLGKELMPASALKHQRSTGFYPEGPRPVPTGAAGLAGPPLGLL